MWGCGLKQTKHKNPGPVKNSGSKSFHGMVYVTVLIIAAPGLIQHVQVEPQHISNLDCHVVIKVVKVYYSSRDAKLRTLVLL